MNGLSTKLQERLALNANWTFLELVSNAVIAGDANRAHQESKKKKALATPSGSAPHKYQMVCAPHHYRPQQHHHQLATCPPSHQNIVPRMVAPPPTVLPPPLQRRGVVRRACYKCGQASHFTKECLAPRQVDAPRLESHTNHPPRVTAAKTGQVNYTTVGLFQREDMSSRGHSLSTATRSSFFSIPVQPMISSARPTHRSTSWQLRASAHPI
jgi:hypothetical protein